jgi:hypothetical protein
MHANARGDCLGLLEPGYLGRAALHGAPTEDCSGSGIAGLCPSRNVIRPWDRDGYRDARRARHAATRHEADPGEYGRG